jgi:drug/metabolite transporter (DMT)-like permease
VALPMLDLSFGRGAGGGLGWFLQSLLIMLAWGVQAYFMRLANHTVRAESIFFYMMLGGLLLAPVALAMTDWSQPVNTGLDGPWMTAAIQLLNAVGALTLVYAFRHGKAIVVAPLTNAGAPLVTAALALVFASVVPGPLKMVGLALALIASLLLVLEPEATAEAGADPGASTSSPEWIPSPCKSSPTSSPGTSRETPVA